MCVQLNNNKQVCLGIRFRDVFATSRELQKLEKTSFPVPIRRILWFFAKYTGESIPLPVIIKLVMCGSETGTHMLSRGNLSEMAA